MTAYKNSPAITRPTWIAAAVSVLDIRPLLWKDGWPVAGDNFKEGTYEIQSVRSGYALELAVDSVPMPGGTPRPHREGARASGRRRWRLLER